jgi:hypothetical protein
MKSIFVSTLIIFCLLSVTTRSQSNDRPCYEHDLSMQDKVLLDSISPYFKWIKSSALPILSIIRSGDTTTIYLSSTIEANAIRDSAPSYITEINSRSVAVFDANKLSIKRLEKHCLEKLVNKLRKQLSIDLMNRKYNRHKKTNIIYTYDGIWRKFFFVNSKLIYQSGTPDNGIQYVPNFQL